MRTSVIIHLSLFLVLCVFNGCKKETTSVVDITKCKVISVTDNSSKEIYSYDTYGRITKVDYQDLFGASGGTRIFDYGYGRLYLSFANSTAKDTVGLTTDGHYVYYYGDSYRNYCYTNAEGRIDSITLGNSGIGTRILFVCNYNADGNLVELKAFDQYKPWYTKTFTYGTEKNVINYCPESLFWTGGWGPMAIEDLRFQSKQFYGKTISNLLPTAIHFQQYDQNTSAPIGSGSTRNYAYIKDSEGKVISITETYDNGTSQTSTLEYSCSQ